MRGSLKFLLGLVNSKFASYYMYNFVYNRAVRSMNLEYISRLPIRRSSIAEKRITKWVDTLLQLNKEIQELEQGTATMDRFTEEFTGAAKRLSLLRQKVTESEESIDDEVFKLYGLSPAEILEIRNQV